MKWSGRAIALIIAMILAPIVAVLPTVIGLRHGLGGDLEIPQIVMLDMGAAAFEVVPVVVLGIPALLLLDRLRVSGIIPVLILGAAIGLTTFVGSYLLLPRFDWSEFGRVGRHPVIAAATGVLGALIYWTIARILDRRASVLESRRT